MRLGLALLLLLAHAGACEAPFKERAGFAITNGAPEAGYPAVGKLAVTGGTCSGTLVGKQTVLTAAHCLAYRDTAFVLDDGTRYPAASVVPHPSYDQTNAPSFYDVGLVRLQQAPALTPATIESAPVAAGTRVTLVGYGSTAAGAGDSGSKRSATNSIAEVQALNFSITGSGGTVGNACLGDSGGPVLIDSATAPSIVGVFSFLEDRTRCGVATWATRLDLFRSWLRQAADGDIRIRDREAPVVAIRAPADQALVTEEVIVEAEVSDDVALTSVEVLLDGHVLEQAQAPPYRFTLTLAPGVHVIEVIARDAAANEGTASINVTARAAEEPSAPAEDREAGGCSLAGRSSPFGLALLLGPALLLDPALLLGPALLFVGLALLRRARGR